MNNGTHTSSALVLFSGGQDSTTCLFWAKERFARVDAIGFDYGQKHAIELDQAAKDLLVTEGYDPVYGARPLKRAIQTLVQNPLAVKLLQGEISSGQTVRVSAADGKLVFTPVEGHAEARA